MIKNRWMDGWMDRQTDSLTGSQGVSHSRGVAHKTFP